MKRLLFFAEFFLLAFCTYADEIRYDFETGDLQGWRVVEGSFGKPVTDRVKEHHSGKPCDKTGKWFLSTLESVDGKSPNNRFTGMVESPVIVLEAPEISMRVGGGEGNRVYVALCTMDGRERAYARGGNSHRMYLRKWHLPDMVGKPVFFRVADGAESNWAHVTLDELVCQGYIDRELSQKRFKQRKLAVVHAERVKKIAALQDAVRELEEKFKDEYPGEALLRKISLATDNDDAAAIDDLQHEALLRHNPLLINAPIIFTTRDQYADDQHNTATVFQAGEINADRYKTRGALKSLDVRSGEVSVLYDPGADATVRDPEIDYDGGRIVFSMRKNQQDNYHIYTINCDGTGLKQLTAASCASDIDPVWLPDSDIVFSSTREPKYGMSERRIMCNLFRMESDGANIHQIGGCSLFEGHPSLLPDGRILYDRWEHVDRNHCDAQGLWVCNQDGTGHAVYYGNNTAIPDGVFDARGTGEGNKVIAVMGAFRGVPAGALGIIDRGIGVNGIEPVLHTWPSVFMSRISVTEQNPDSSGEMKIKYEDPWPLDDEHFLCSRTLVGGDEMAIYYIDLHGNEIPVHSEPPGCYDPMPLAPRQTPPSRISRRNFSRPEGTGSFYVQNVYNGTHMKNVRKGSIKYLRIVETPEKRFRSGGSWGGQGPQAPAMNWHSLENKRILGTVPVEEDGSAYFEVPANTFLYFQALDKYRVMVQSMRSGIFVQPGETYGCVGCHESRVAEKPQSGARPAALKRPPEKLKGWHGHPRRFSFQREVQPILDKHCVECHDYGRKAGDALNLSGDRDVVFCTSYVDLWVTGALSCIGGGPAAIQQAGSWGSSRSPLIEKIFQGHAGVELPEKELEKITAWVDLNAPYYPFYEYSSYGDNPGGRCPLTDAEIERICKLTGKKICFSHSPSQRSVISFERPELSRILKNMDDTSAGYAEVVALIRLGSARLKSSPRADMPGFQPVSSFIAVQERYNRYMKTERRVYKAIREDRKVYDWD
ncbi:MAG: hypothetical protein R6V06_00840 [Kiritimatiellia bacterium]